jgi:hypothetical protein
VQGARAVTTGNKESQISHQRSPYQAALEVAGQGSSLPSAAASPVGLLPTRRWPPGMGFALRPSWEPSPIGGAIATLAGCATHKKQPQSADAHEIAHGTRRDTPGRTGTGWEDVAASAQLEGLAEARAGPLRTARGQFRSRCVVTACPMAEATATPLSAGSSGQPPRAARPTARPGRPRHGVEH